MDTLVLISSILFFIGGIVSFILKPRPVISKTVVCKYETSKDYKHLRELLDEGQRVICWYADDYRYPSVAYLSHFSDAPKYIFPHEKVNKSASDEEFAAFCTYKHLVFLDYIMPDV